MAAHPQGRTALYRLFNAEGVLLYIGISSQPEVRRKQHVAQQPWGHLISRQEVEWRDDRPTAERAEEAAIASESPLYNRDGNRSYQVAASADELSIAAARNQLPALVERARYYGGITLLTNRGKRVAAVAPVELGQFADSVGGPAAAVRILKAHLESTKS